MVGHAAEDQVKLSFRDALLEVDIFAVRIVIQLVVVLRSGVNLYAVTGERRALGRPGIYRKPDAVAAPSVSRIILDQDKIGGTVLHRKRE